MRKPSLLPLLLTPALVAFASSAHAVATASSSAPATAPATSSSQFSGVAAESMATSPRSTAPGTSASGTSTASSSGTTSSGSAASNTSPNAGSFNSNDVVGIPNQAAIGPTANPSPFAPGSTFSTDNGNPELGTSPGQTSPGTAVGNEPSGLDAGTATLDANGNFNGVPAGAPGAGAVAPVDVIGGVSGGYAAPAYSGGNTTIVAPGRPLVNGAAATPLLDQATRNAQRRIERERATGRTPRVIGIAPRTDADRTDEMPDDPIIRY